MEQRHSSIPCVQNPHLKNETTQSVLNDYLDRPMSRSRQDSVVDKDPIY